MPFDYRAGLEREWAETDGRGHWARGTASGPNTRRSHGLLAAISKGGRTRMLLHHFEEWITLASGRFPLSSTIYKDLGTPARVIVQPPGHNHLESFHAAPFPRWVFALGTHRLIKTLRPVGGEPGFVLEYLLIASHRLTDGATNTAPLSTATLELRPFLSGRDATGLATEYRPQAVEPRHDGRGWSWSEGDAPPLHLSWPVSGRWTNDAHWYHHLRLVASGQDEESAWSPGLLAIPLTPDLPASVGFSSGPGSASLSTAAPQILLEANAAPAAAETSLRRSVAWDHAHVAHWTSPAGSQTVSTSESILALLWLADRLEDDCLDALTAGASAGISDEPIDIQLAWTLVLAERARRGRRDPEAAAAALDRLDVLLSGQHPAAAPTSGMLLRIRQPGQSFWDRLPENEAPWRALPIDIQALWANALAAGEILSAVSRPGITSPYGRLFLRVADAVRRLYWISDRSTLADDLEARDGDEDLPDEKRPPGRRISSASVLAQALRFEILPPSRARAVLEHARRFLAFESHPRGGGESGTLIGLRSFADLRAAYPLLVAPWLIARARLSPGKPAPGLTAAGILRFFTANEETSVPSRIDPQPPNPLADPRSANKLKAEPPSLAALAGLVAAALAQGET